MAARQLRELGRSCGGISNRNGPSGAEADAQLSRNIEVARNAEGAEILKRALPAAFYYGHHMVRIPGGAQAVIRDAEFMAATAASVPGQFPQ
jgi:hypothetical protein